MSKKKKAMPLAVCKRCSKLDLGKRSQIFYLKNNANTSLSRDEFPPELQFLLGKISVKVVKEAKLYGLVSDSTKCCLFKVDTITENILPNIS